MNNLSKIARLARRVNFGREEGSTLVEFALASTIYLTVLFGIVQTSIAVYSYCFVSEAARDCARYALVRGSASCGAAYSPQMPDCNATQAQIQTHLRSLNYPGIISSNLTANVTWYSFSKASGTAVWTACATQCSAPGNAVQVQVTYPFVLNVPFVPQHTISMGNSSMMVISQ